MGHKEHPLGWPSVTQVLAVVNKPFLAMWRGRVGNTEADRVMRDAGDLGTRVHSAVEGHLKGQLAPELGETEAKCLKAFIEWQSISGFTPTVIEPEKGVESRLYQYSGTFDAIGTLGSGQLVICDWKTSSALDDLYGAQLAAYSAAWYETTGQEITSGIVVRLDKKAKKPKYEVKEFVGLDRYFKVFLNCLAIWNFVNKKGEWAE